jgi:hypothetical protein
VRHAGHTDFAQLVPHLRLLNHGSALQNLPAGWDDKVSNKLFELRFALACMRGGTELLVDDPDASSGGTNPDVIARMLQRKRWGFACKVISGDAPMTLFERIEEGVEQIERSPCDVGVVAISMKNRMPNDVLFPVLEEHEDRIVIGAHVEWQQVQELMSAAWRERFEAMRSHVGVAELARIFEGKKAIPAVMCAMETVTAVVHPDFELPMLMLLSFLHVESMAELSVDHLEVLVSLSKGWQNK